jgi:hypothetical protein
MNDVNAFRWAGMQSNHLIEGEIYNESYHNPISFVCLPAE